MSFLRAITLTIIFWLSIELVGTWPFILDLSDSPIQEEVINPFLLKNYRLIQGSLQLFVSLVFIVLLKVKVKTSIPKPVISWLTVAIAIGLVCTFIQVPLSYIYSELFDLKSVKVSFSGILVPTSLNVISPALIIPIGEELFFRQIILKKLLTKYHLVSSLVVSALLFSLIHISIDEFHLIKGWLHPFMSFISGLILGLLFYKSKSITLTILAHGVSNLATNTLY